MMNACTQPLEREIEIVNALGLHTLASTRLVKVAQGFVANVELALDGVCADAKSILELLTLGAKKGSRIVVSVEGPDSEAALEAVCGLIASGFEEKSE